MHYTFIVYDVGGKRLVPKLNMHHLE